MPRPHPTTIAVSRTLRKLGSDIRDARRRRNLPASVVAERAFTTRPTLHKVEKGDAGVGIGIYASVLQALGLLERLSEVADASNDLTGLALSAEALPERVRLKRRKPNA